MKKYKYFQWLAITCILLYGWCFRSFSCLANQKIEPKGDVIEFTTTDTKATSSITWREVGFTVRRDRSYGNPLKDSKVVYVPLSEPWKQYPLDANTYTVIFRFSRKQIDDALASAGLGTTDENDTFYMNGVFAVNRNGTDDSGYYYTLNSIMNAAPWRNPYDFYEHFDIEVKFPVQHYPVEAQCLTDQNVVLKKYSFSDVDSKKKENENFHIDFPEVIHKDGDEYKLYRSYYVNLQAQNQKKADRSKKKGNSIEEIKDRTEKVEAGGIRMVARYRKTYNVEKRKLTEDWIYKELDETIESEAEIRSMDRTNEQYDVEEGIPSSEKVYVDGTVPAQLYTYSFRKMVGEKIYPITVKKTYKLTWTEEQPSAGGAGTNVSRMVNQSVSKKYYIHRPYSFWYVADFRIYIPEIMMYRNNIFISGNKGPGNVGQTPEGKKEVRGLGISIPLVSSVCYGSIDEHLQEPVYEAKITLPSAVVDGGTSRPSVPNEDFTPNAEAAIGNIKARSDRLSYNGDVWMKNGFQEIEGLAPEFEEKEFDMTDFTCFLQEGIQIPAEKANGSYSSEAVIRYICSDDVRSELSTEEVAEDIIDHTGGKEHDYVIHVETPGKKYLYYNIENVNPVVVHTPVVCDPLLEDKYRDCQLVNPSYQRCQLVLGKGFELQFPTEGQHLPLTGYGYRDYGTFTAHRQVQFPFPVYQVDAGMKYYMENTWIEVSTASTFYLPTWVSEGQYTVAFRSLSINAEPNHQIEAAGEFLNQQRTEYVAVKYIDVEVSGRIYGLALYDVSDYPLWYSVFRAGNNSLARSGRMYRVGDKNENGQSLYSDSMIFPLLRGSHPFDSTKGILKGGYHLRFRITTIGNMSGNEDAIEITPSFYYINVEKGIRIPVDLYYQETIQGQLCPLIRVGSTMDQSSKKKLRLGDPYLSIPEAELMETSMVLGNSKKVLMERTGDVYSYHQILLRPWMQQLVGNSYQSSHAVSLNDGQSASIVGKSVQNWYFEYSLPADFHAVAKGTKIQEQGGEAIDFSENYWLKNGYLLLNFDIQTKQNGKAHLSYINEAHAWQGYRDMWKYEGFKAARIDQLGRQYQFEEGDIALFSLTNSTKTDYVSGGTH